MEKEVKKPHSFSVESRNSCSMSGIEKVISSSDTSITVISSCGEMEIVGKKLKISKFEMEDGTFCFDGEIDCIKYSAPKVPLIKRLFK